MIQFATYILLIIISAFFHARKANQGRRFTKEDHTQFAAILFWSALLLSWFNIVEMIFMFITVLCIYRSFRNIFEQRSVFYINTETKLGKLLDKHSNTVHTVRAFGFALIILVHVWK